MRVLVTNSSKAQLAETPADVNDIGKQMGGDGPYQKVSRRPTQLPPARLVYMLRWKHEKIKLRFANSWIERHTFQRASSMTVP